MKTSCDYQMPSNNIEHAKLMKKVSSSRKTYGQWLLVAKGNVEMREAPLPPLHAYDVRVQSLFSSIKHGTELVNFNEIGPFHNQNFDPQLRLFHPGHHQHIYPAPVGNMTAGRVLEVGEKVASVRIGDLVFGWLPLRDIHVCAADTLYPLDGLTPEEAVCIDPAIFALAAVRDAKVGVGDTVAVIGLGAIGLLAIQLLKQSGARVLVSSSFARRRELAARYGADIVLDSRRADIGWEMKKLTRGGVDVAIECSGYYTKLHQAIRATRQCGRVVAVGFYTGAAHDLRLGEEFFHNRITLFASLPDWENPDRDYPLWDRNRLLNTVITSFKKKKLKIDGLLTPVMAYTQVAEAFSFIVNHPEDCVKVGITY